MFVNPPPPPPNSILELDAAPKEGLEETQVDALALRI